ncbi:hypothetical protein [Saccharomonospora sp. CUA-673]|uniref:hypothetical protein n=1 Tax=Saccharomonospora sp. CUA-673 TaxID=1904969 RepID=UPI000AAB9A24|nr:hypothetical protein [Saccharomonospora sp. CUA-673]
MDHGTHTLTGSSAVDGLTLAIRLALLLATVVVAGAGLLRPLGGALTRRARIVVGGAGAVSAVLALVSVVALDVNVVGGVLHAVLSVAVVATAAHARVCVWPSGALLVLLVVETAAGRSGLELMLDLVVVTAAATWFGVVVAVSTGTWRGETVRPGGLMTALGVVLTVAGVVALALSGLGPDRRLVTTGLGVAVSAAVVLPVAATVLVVAARRERGFRPGNRFAAIGVAAAFVAWTATPAMAEPQELPIPGVPVLAEAGIAGGSTPVLISPNRPGTNLVHLPASAGDEISVGVEGADGGRFVPAGGRRGAPGTWAEVELPEGRSQVVLRSGNERTGGVEETAVEVDTGTDRTAPAGSSGVDGPECATAALGGRISGARDVLRSCPSQELTDRDERAVRALVGYLADREVPALVLADDASPRSAQAAAAVRDEAREVGLPVRDEPAEEAALVVLSGWSEAQTRVRQAAQEQADGPTYLYGVHLAPWLLTTPVVTGLTSSSLPLDFDPRGANAVEHVVELAGASVGRNPPSAATASGSPRRTARTAGRPLTSGCTPPRR